MNAHRQCCVVFCLAECIVRSAYIGHTSLYINEKHLPSDLFPVTPEQVTNADLLCNFVKNAKNVQLNVMVIL